MVRRDHDEKRTVGILRVCRRAIPLSLVCLPLLPAGAFAAGMPQLDFSTPLTVSQVVWGAVIFVVLYVMLARVGLPRVASVLEERAGHIHRDLEGARAAKTKADADTEEAASATAAARAGRISLQRVIACPPMATMRSPACRWPSAG